jgi:hypothetical protein
LRPGGKGTAYEFALNVQANNVKIHNNTPMRYKFLKINGFSDLIENVQGTCAKNRRI